VTGWLLIEVEVLDAQSILKTGDAMKSYHSIARLVLAGAAVAVSFAGSASAADLSGSWNISATYMSGGQIVGTDTPACTFQQSGNRISGTCKGPHAIGPLEGTTNGSSVSLQWNHTATNSGGVTGSSYYQGSAGADGVIRGNASNSSIPGATGTFTAQRQ
jgi:hypothetical protein